MSKFLVESNLKGYLKKYKLAIIYSFIVGLFIGSMPFIYKAQKGLRVQKLIQEERLMRIQNNEKICKGENSEYKKYLILGFPKTAIKRFNICMEEQ